MTTTPHLSQLLSPSNRSSSISFLLNQKNIPLLSPSSNSSQLFKQSSFSHHPDSSQKGKSSIEDFPTFSRQSSKASGLGSFSTYRGFPHQNTSSRRQPLPNPSALTPKRNKVSSIVAQIFSQNNPNSASSIRSLQKDTKRSFSPNESLASFISLYKSSKKSLLGSKEGRLTRQSQPEEAPMSTVIRRKSCCCSDCGGISKKEKLNLALTQECPRESINRTAASQYFLKEPKEDPSDTPRSCSSLNQSKKKLKKVGPSSFQFPNSKSFGTIQLENLISNLGSEDGIVNISRPLSHFARGRMRSTTVCEVNAGEGEQRLARGSTKSIQSMIPDIQQQTEVSLNRTSLDNLEDDADRVIEEFKSPSIEIDNMRRNSIQIEKRAIKEKSTVIVKGKEAGNLQPRKYTQRMSLGVLETLEKVDEKVVKKKPRKKNGLKAAVQLKEMMIMDAYVGKPQTPKDQRFSLQTIKRPSTRLASIKREGPRLSGSLADIREVNQFRENEKEGIENIPINFIGKSPKGLEQPIGFYLKKGIGKDGSERKPQSMVSLGDVEIVETVRKGRKYKPALGEELKENKTLAQPQPERVILKSSRGKRTKVKTLLVGELKKVYQSQNKDVKIAKLR